MENPSLEWSGIKFDSEWFRKQIQVSDHLRQESAPMARGSRTGF